MEMTIAAGIASARAALELVRLGVAARDEAKVQAAITDANLKLMDLSTAALALAEKNLALQADLTTAQREKAEIEAKVNDRAQYALHEIRPGAFVYRFQPVGEGAQAPVHYLCQPCYDKGVKTVLQHQPARAGKNAGWQCSNEHQHLIAEPGTALPQPRFY